MGLHGHSPWCVTDISYAAEVKYWLTSRVSKTLKLLPDNTCLNKLSRRPHVLIHRIFAHDDEYVKILCVWIQMRSCWTLTDFLSAGQNNDMSDISSISWHHCLSLTRKLWGYLIKINEKKKAEGTESSLTFRSADFPYLEGIRPANLKRPWTWTGGSLIRKTSDH